MAYLGRSPSQGVRNRYYFTASGGETSVSGALTGGTLTFTDGNYVDVNLNGVTLVAGTDYNTSTANTIAGLSALTASDVVEIVVYDVFSVFSGNVNSDFSVGGNLSVTGTTAFTGATTITGLTTTGDINFGDNDKAVFGAGNDLQIYHANNNSFIEDVGTGNFLITTNGNNIQLMKNQAEQMLVAKTDGAVELYHDNAKKLETSSTGIDITGAFTATDQCIISSANNVSQLILKSTDADASSGPILDLTRDSGSPADNDVIGMIRYNADNDAAQSINLVQFKGQLIDASDSTESATLFINIMSGGTRRTRQSFSPTETVFNEDSVDVDFRVESLGDANSFVVEGATKGIGMGTNDPTIDSSLAGINVPGGARVLHINDTDGAYLKLSDPASGSNRGAQFAMIGTDAILNNCESGTLIFGTGNAERMRISSGGNIRMFQTGTDSPGIGNTTTGHAFQPGGIVAFSSASAYVSINRNGDGTRLQFNNSGNTRGSITVTGTTTAYNTSSDRRLKSNIQDAASASSKIDAMKVRQFDWTEDGKHQDYGMIAQELQSVEPLAVSGSEDSNKMMGVDYSILVPMLIKEIQELRSRVAALEE
jgi:hypothetical protein